MALRDRKMLNFNIRDHTFTICTQEIAKNNDPSLYTQCTVANIRLKQDVSEMCKKPNISASIQHSRIFIVIDDFIMVFQDETCKPIFSKTFPDAISCYCISEDGLFLYVLLTNGALMGYLLLENKTKLRFSRYVSYLKADKSNNIIKMFFEKKDKKSYIILVSNTGAIYSHNITRRSHLPSDLTYDSSSDSSFDSCSGSSSEPSLLDNSNILSFPNNDECISETKKNKYEDFKGFLSTKFLDAVIDSSSGEQLITVIGEDSIFTWYDGISSVVNKCNASPVGYRKIKLLEGSNKMLCLHTNHVLSIICPNTLLELKICDDLVFDFTVIRYNDTKHCKISFLTKSKNNDDAYTLCLVSYPDFEQKFEIEVPATVLLFKDLHSCNNIFYVEYDTDITCDTVYTCSIKMILENTPEMHLARLLREEQCDAAESFAERFTLPMEPVYCSKAALLIKQLSPWAGLAPSSVSVDALIDNLDKIQDVQYIIECCSKALISNYIQMKQLYLYIQQRIVQNIKKEDTDDKLNTSLSMINDKLHKLETFYMIHDFKSDSLLHDEIAIKEWKRFSEANLLDECIVYLRMDQLNFATLIWIRHFHNITKHVSVQVVQNILAILPEDMALSCLWPWLVHFISTSLFLLPDAMDEIICWGLKKLKYIEISNCAAWPEVGIEFVKQFVKLLKFEDDQQFSYLHQEYKYRNSVLQQFMHIFQALSEIQQLKNIYRLKIPLDVYIDSPIEVIYIILNKIHLDEIVDFTNTFLKQYMLNNNLQNDVVLCTYIQKTIKNYNWQFGEETIWEKRVVIIIDLIHNLEKRLKQTLEVLKVSPVPWSSTMITLAETSSNFDHSLSFKIKIERDYVPVKIVLRKYGYATNNINNVRINRLIISRIIKEDRASIINDIDVLTKNLLLKRDIFCRCINARLNEGNLEKAMSIICHLERNVTDALYCYEGIINYIVAGFSFQNAVTSLAYHMEILNCLELKISNLLAQSKIHSSHYNNIVNTITDLKSIYTLKKDYEIDTSLNDYRMQKLLVLQNYIAKRLPASIKEDDILAIHKTIIEIAKLLGLEKSDAILSLLEWIKNVNILQQFISDEEVLDVALYKFKNINKICLLALQHTDINVNTMEAVRKLNVSMLNTCQNCKLQSVLLLHTCINTYPNSPAQNYFDIKHTSRFNWKLYTTYEDQVISLDQRLLSLYKDAMSLYLYYSDQVDNSEIAYYNNEQIEEMLNNFLTNIKEMQLQYSDYSLLQIFKTIYFMYCSTPIRNESILKEMKCILLQLLKNLLKKLCTSRSLDLHLGLACLFMLPEQEACAWISATSTSSQADHIRHSIISTLGYEYLRLGKNRPLIQTFENYKLLYMWAQRLSHYSIASKEILANNASSKKEILQQIINSNKENMIFLLKDYCCTFKFNFNDCLLLCLQTLLKTWNPSITTSNISANNELLICKEEIDELRKKCDAIVAQMEDKSILNQCISTLWDHIIFYHYEVFLILMDLVGDKNMEKRNYLCFLQNYTRYGSPTPMEHDEWIQLNPGHGTLPPIAQWRLPFLIKIDIWKIITPELNLRTYNKWLEIAPVLNLETHLICTLAIKGEVTLVWGDNSTKLKDTTWSLYPKNNELLEGIHKCIERITDKNGYYYGTAALYYVVNHIPPGADRVAAAKQCYEYAQLTAQNSTKLEQGMLKKIEFKYLRFSSENILRAYNLGKDKYLALIENPCKLISELYNDESIPLRYRSTTDYKPDINAAVNKLGELFSLNMIKMRLTFLEEWLRSNSKYDELSQSFTETLLVLKEPDQNTDYENDLLRACYMLEYGDTDLFAQFLINIAFGDYHGDNEYTCDARYRALRVLQTILDTTALEELTKRDICTFRKYMKSLQYIGKLESLGLCYSVNTFEKCSKRELVLILWKNQRHSPRVLSVITQICIEFDIQDILLWNNILAQMTKLQMVNELKRVLLKIQYDSIIVSCAGYKMGWQEIISEPFTKMYINPSSEQINNCIEAIRLLYSCPTVHELDFIIIVEHCFQCKQAHLAAALLPFLKESEKNFVLQTINETCQITELREDLNNLSSKGVLTVAQSLIIVQEYMP